MTDAYDSLCNLAQLDGVRIAPLFLVFVNPASAAKPWRVCGTSLEGDPVSDHSQHSTLRAAFNEAARANEVYAGIKPYRLKVRIRHARRIAPLKRGA
jgi:hypothetical protein